MEIERLIRNLRFQSEKHKNDVLLTGQLDISAMTLDAAAALTAQQQEIAELKAENANLRNELCLKCGRYHEAHNGACDGCRLKL